MIALHRDPTAQPGSSEALAPAAARSKVRRLALGDPADPRWARPALLLLLAATAALYLWDLGASGWANTYYAAAVQAGTQSWKAFFFGSFDAANFVTVDKSPLFLWPMELSARVFGLNAWSMLVPQAIEGVAAVGLLHASVRRWFPPAAALLAGAVLALTPVAALMFRFNNPDAMLVLLMTAGAYALVRSLEKAQWRWILAAFAFVGLAFLAKMLQALLVVPAFGFAYLLCAPTGLVRRIGQLAASAVAMVTAAGWWVAIVELWPAASRPYIGGSQNNTVLNLIFGYNGFGRLTGEETGSVGGGGGGGNGSGGWGATGLFRLFNGEFGAQASWLLPAAFVLLAGMVVVTARMPRTNRTRAAAILWGGWLVVTSLAISFGQGIIHPYYTVALGPGIGGVVGVGGLLLWRRRRTLVARGFLAAAMAVTAWWSFTLLRRTPEWYPWLRGVVLVGGLMAAVAIVAVPRRQGRWSTLVSSVALLLALAGPAAYSLATVTQPHSGSLPSAGPAGSSMGGFAAGPGGILPGGVAPAGNAAGPGGTATTGRAPTAGGLGGLLNGSSPSAELTATLAADHDQFTWVAATVGANQAGGYQLATGAPMMAIGGFNGTDPTPTLEQFQQYVAEGRIHYFIAGGMGGGGFGGGGPGGAAIPGSTSAASGTAISSWVTSNFSTVTVGTVTLYDLTAPLQG